MATFLSWLKVIVLAVVMVPSTLGQTLPTECGRALEDIPDPASESCVAFFRCYNQRKYIIRCPLGQAFHFDRSRCRPEREVDCPLQLQRFQAPAIPHHMRPAQARHDDREVEIRVVHVAAANSAPSHAQTFNSGPPQAPVPLGSTNGQQHYPAPVPQTQPISQARLQQHAPFFFRTAPSHTIQTQGAHPNLGGAVPTLQFHQAPHQSPQPNLQGQWNHGQGLLGQPQLQTQGSPQSPNQAFPQASVQAFPQSPDQTFPQAPIQGIPQVSIQTFPQTSAQIIPVQGPSSQTPALQNNQQPVQLSLVPPGAQPLSGSSVPSQVDSQPPLPQNVSPNPGSSQQQQQEPPTQSPPQQTDSKQSLPSPNLNLQSTTEPQQSQTANQIYQSPSKSPSLRPEQSNLKPATDDHTHQASVVDIHPLPPATDDHTHQASVVDIHPLPPATEQTIPGVKTKTLHVPPTTPASSPADSQSNVSIFAPSYEIVDRNTPSSRRSHV